MPRNVNRPAVKMGRMGRKKSPRLGLPQNVRDTPIRMSGPGTSKSKPRPRRLILEVSPDWLLPPRRRRLTASIASRVIERQTQRLERSRGNDAHE